MTHQIDNDLLLHGEEPAIPYPTLQSVNNDALKPDCADRYASLQRQVEALEEANKRVCDERDFYLGQCHAYEARLAGREFD
jgi:hypothetical protein